MGNKMSDTMGNKLTQVGSQVGEFIEKKIKKNEETGHDPAVHGAKQEDRYYNNDAFNNPSVDASNPQQQDAALAIQTQYRQHKASEEVNHMKEEEAALKIQAGIRGYQDRTLILQQHNPEEYERRQKEIQDRIASRDAVADDEEIDIDLNDPDVEKAAVKIQAGFKGFKARKEVKETQSKTVEEEEEIDIDLKDPEVNKAAVKIQAGFRGHKSRLEYKSLQKAKEIEDELADIDLNDPDLDKAALKIQSSFRGHMTRRQMGLEMGEDSRKKQRGASQKDTKLIKSIFQKKQPGSASKPFSWYNNSSNDDPSVESKPHANERRKWWSLIRKPSNILSVLSYSTTTHHSTDSSWYSSSSEYGSDADTVVKPKIQRAVGFFRDMLENLRRTTDSDSDSEEDTEEQHVEEFCENVINEQAETLSHNTSSSYTDSSSSTSGFKRQFTVPTYTPSTLPSVKHWVERPSQSMDEFYEHISTTNEAIRKDLKQPLKRTLSSEREIKKNVISALWDNMQHSKAHPPFPVRPKKKITPGGRFKMVAKKVISGFRDQRICYRTGVHHCTADIHAPPRVEVTPWYMLNRLGYIDTSVNANVVNWLSETENYQSESESSLDYTDPVFVKYVLLLQSVFRSRLAKKYWRLKPENSYSLVKACLLIQSVFRSRMARRKYEKFKKFHNDHINLKNPNLRHACIIVQSVFRYRLRRKSLGLYVLSKPRVELDKNDLNYDLIKACLLIQAQFRTNLALKMCLSKSSSFENSDTDSKYSIRDAAILIQSAFRSKLAITQLSSYLDWIERSSNSEVSSNQTTGLKSKSKHITWDPLIPNDSGVEKISLTKQYFIRKKQRESRSAIEQDPKLLHACLLIQSMFRSKLTQINSPLCRQESFYNNLKHYLTNQNTQRAVETIQHNIRQVLNKKTQAIYTAAPVPHVQKATSFLQSAFREKLGPEDIHTRTLLNDPNIVRAVLLVQSAFRSYLFHKGSDPPTPTNLGKTQNFDDKTLKKSLAMLQINPTKRNIDGEDDDDEEDTLSCDSSDSPCAANEIDLEWSNTDIPPRPLLQRQHTDAGEALHRSYQSYDFKDLRKQYSVDSYLDTQHQSYFDPLSKKPSPFEYFEPKMPRSKISLQKLKSSSISGSISEEQYYFDPKLRKATQLLQNAFRSHTARKKMKEQWFSQKYSTHHKRADDSRNNVRFRRAVLLIQSAFRTKLDKRWMTKMENLHNSDFSSSFQSYCTENTAAKVIQSAFMKHLTKKLLTQTIEQRIKAKQSSTTNTAMIRAIVRRHSSSSLPHQFSDQDSGTLRAILMMQAVFRYKLIQKEKAALLLQCVFKKTFRKGSLEVTPLKPRRYKDHVVLLQSVFRRKLFMKVVEDARAREGLSLSSDKIIKHVITLQSLCRIFFARKRKFEESVRKVQSCIRRKLLIDIVNELQHSSVKNSAEQSVRHIICLQTLVRTYLSRKERYTKSVLLVQAAFRRRLLVNILERFNSRTPKSVFRSVYYIQLFFRTYLERKQRYIQNIIIVQTACRKKLLQKIIDRKIQEKHIIMIQRAIRQKLDRKIVLKAEQIVANVLNVLRCNSDKLNSALTPSEIIPDTTSFFIMPSSDETSEVYIESVKLLQNAFRQRLLLKAAHQQKILNAVLLLQNAFRRHVVLKTVPKSSDPNLYRSAVFLQSIMRSKLACDEQAKMTSAAKLIQGEYRKRLLIKSVTDEPQKASSILFLQSAFRSGLDHNEAADDSSHFDESTVKAALILQSAFRRKLLMKNVLGAQLLDPKSSFEKSVILIQTIIRKKLAKKQTKPKLKDTNTQKSLIDSFFEMNMAELSSPKKTEKSGKGSFFSMFSSSPEPQGVKKAFNFLESGLRNLIASPKQNSRENYIILIQSAMRMKLAIKRHRQKQAALLLQAAFRDRILVKNYCNRVVTVQSAFRSKLAEKSSSVILIHPIFHANDEEKIEIERQKMIVKIQAAFRKKLLEKKRQQLTLFFELEENVDIFEKHVCRIQSAVRRKLKKKEADFERAVIMIQSGFRRNLLPDMSPSEDVWRVSEIELERAALMIQSAFRLRLYRKQISSNDDTYEDSSASSVNTVEYLGKDVANDPFMDVFTQHQHDTQGHEETEVKAVILLQSAFRQHLHQKEERIKFVQSVIRRKLLMNLVYQQKDKYHLVRNDLLAARLIKATVLMQAAFRNHLRLKEKGVLILQCAFRRRLLIKSRDAIHKKQVEVICGLCPSEISRACLLIQSAFRQHLKMKEDLNAESMTKYVLLLQSAFRTRLLLKQVQPANSLKYGISRGISPSAYITAVLLIQNAVRNHLRRREKGILMIQSAFRKILLHRLVQNVYGIYSVEFAIIPALHLSKGVTLIQTAFRHRLRLKEQSIKLLQAAFRKKLLLNLTNQVSIPNLYPKKSPGTILRSVLLLQTAFRREVQRKENAAAMIQTAFRKRILLNIVSEIEEKVDSQYSSTTSTAVTNSVHAQSEKVFRILKATLLIQAIFRNNVRKKEKAVLMVQSAFRGKLLMRLTHRARSVKEFETWIDTITLVQSAFRKHLRRKERHVILLQTAFRKRLFINVARNASKGRGNMTVERMEVLIRGIIRVQQAIRFHTERKEQLVCLIQNAFRMKLLTKVASHTLTSNQSQTTIVSYSAQDNVPIDHVLLLQRAFRQRLLLKVGREVYGQNEPLTPQELDNLLRGIVLVQTAFKTHLLQKQKAAELLQNAFRRRMLLNIAQRLDETDIAIPPNRLAQLLNGIRLVQTVFRQRLRQNEHAALMLQAAFRRRLLLNVAQNHLKCPSIGHAGILIKRIILVQTAIRRHTDRKREACLMIQAAFRRNLLLKLSKNHKQHNVPSVIQATNLIRGIILLQSAIRRQLHADERGVLLMQAAYKKHQFLKLCSSVKEADATSKKCDNASKPEIMIRAVLLVQSAFRQKIHAKTFSEYEKHILIVQAAFRRHLMLKLCSRLPNTCSLPAGNLVRGIILVQSSFRNHMRRKEKGILMLQVAFRRNLLMKVFRQLPEKQSLRPENLIRGILLFQGAIRFHLHKREEYVIMLQAAFRRHLLMKIFWHLPVEKQMETQPEQLVKGIILFQSAVRYHIRHKENGIKMLQAAFRRRLLMNVFKEIPYERQAFYRPEKLMKGILLFQSAIRDHQMKKEQGILLLQAAFRKRLLFKVFDKLPYTSQLCSRPENLLRGVMLFQSAVRHHMRQKAKGVLILQVAFRRRLLMKVFKELPKRNRVSLRPENLIRGIILFQSAIRYHIQQREHSVLMLQVAFRRRLLLKAVSKVSRQNSSENLIRGIVLFQSVIRYQQERKRKAVLMVQTAFRMKLLQNVTMMTSQNKFRDCLRIERLIRGIILFQSSIRYHQQQKLNAALLLQAAFRRKLLLKVVERANVDFELKAESLENQDAKEIPNKEMQISKTIKSVILVQSIIRRHLERHERHVILIQTAFRTKLLLKIARQEGGSPPSPVNVVLLTKAIIHIQTVFRLKLKRKESSIILVQSAFRRRLLVQVANTIQPNIPVSQLIRSVLFVQSIIRVKLLRKRENTLFIQAAIRQTLMKRMAKRFSQSSEKEPENFSAVRLVKAAILIQTAFKRRLENLEGGAKMIQNAYRTRQLLKAIDYDIVDLK